MTSFYQRHYEPLFEPMIDMMLHGIAMDNRKRVKRLGQLTADCIRLQDQLTEVAGVPLYGKKSLSTKKLAAFLYEDLRLPKKFRTRKRASGEKVRTVTTDEVAVKRLMNGHPKNERLQRAGSLILAHRRKYQLSSFYRENRVDEDGRMRSSYGPYADSGRFRSSENPCGTGSNAQNIDREARDCFVPDDGCVFVELDLSLAEDRDVKVRTRAPRLIALAKLPPWEWDGHQDNAAKAFHKQTKDVTKEERYVAKRVKHGTNYGEQADRISDELLKDGFIYPPEECQRMMEVIVDPEVLEWQREVRATVLKNRCLANAWGRVISFEHERFSDDLYRRAYAYCPSSDMTCELINRQGFVPAWHWLKRTGYGKINVHNHDSLLASIQPRYAWEYACWLRDSLQKPVRIVGTMLTIWVELKVGMTWGELVEYKRWPTEREFGKTVRRLCA